MIRFLKPEDMGGTFEQVVTKFNQSLDSEIVNNNLSACKMLVKPERIITFRVPWIDDKEEVHVNMGYRVQWNSALGPYKGGLRFHPSVDLDTMKFLAFEQTFKNALTGQSLGGAKGGSDFDPRGKSDKEVMGFCFSFMSELHKYIGRRMDVPAGDIGVGHREIGYLFGAYKKFKGEFTGVFTGKGLEWGGSHMRPEATGYGNVYFAQNMSEAISRNLEGQKCLISGSGNVAFYTAEKLISIGAKPITFSDSNGYIYKDVGFTRDDIEHVYKLKFLDRGRLKELSDLFTYVDSESVWGVKADCAFPSATENELDIDNASKLVSNGVWLVSEGANMPCTPEAINHFIKSGVQYGPGKASNAGGVSVSGFEMAQNSMRIQWSRGEVDAQLKRTMRDIFNNCREASIKYGRAGNYMVGASISGFERVAKAVMNQGII